MWLNTTRSAAWARGCSRIAVASLGLAALGCGSDGSDDGNPDSGNSGGAAGSVNTGGTSVGGSGSGAGPGTGASGGSAGSGGEGGASGAAGAGQAGGGTGGGAGNSGGSGGASLQPCATRITYGSAWLKPGGKKTDFDVVEGKVTWDGSCPADGGGNGTASLSNGWKPVFKGRNCIIALDYSGDCSGVPSQCETRVSYGASWKSGPNHPNHYDDAPGVVTWNGVCSSSTAPLSNGWVPHFSGVCDLSFRHTQCGGLYANPVLDVDCPDPGVMRDGDTYYMSCTPGPGYRIYSSKDLVSWKQIGTIFTNATKPPWGVKNFWAPEIHKVAGKYVAYFSAHGSNTYAVGAATSSKPEGPYQDIGKPLVTEPHPGAIDAHYFKASSGKHYILWKIDGNAVGQKTPIKIQELAPDGLSRVGSAKTILTNTLGWEGALVEGPWLVERGGSFYLFYSGNGYGSPNYGVGVAKASSPMGTYTKLGNPILSSKAGWAGPGHGAILKGPSGDWVHVYHSWIAGKVNQAPGRIVLVDRVQWSGGWPRMRGAPSSRSQPMP